MARVLWDAVRSWPDAGLEIGDGMSNVDRDTVAGFGQEWSRFPQPTGFQEDLRSIFQQYFAIFPWDDLPPDPVGVDIGAGSGRWARFVAERVAGLVCVEPSEPAALVAQRNLTDHPRCRVVRGSAGELPLRDESFDFGYCLGVLHHVPDTERALADSVDKLRPGAPFLAYLYYAFDNRPAWYRSVWRLSDLFRRAISRLPFRVRSVVTDVIAVVVYWPLSRLARIAGRLHEPWKDRLPLAAYGTRPLYFLRTDALDRFGTGLEKRFTQAQIREMMLRAGLDDVRFWKGPPYWVVVGRKSRT